MTLMIVSAHITELAWMRHYKGELLLLANKSAVLSSFMMTVNQPKVVDKMVKKKKKKITAMINSSLFF